MSLDWRGTAQPVLSNAYWSRIAVLLVEIGHAVILHLDTVNLLRRRIWEPYAAYCSAEPSVVHGFSHQIVLEASAALPAPELHGQTSPPRRFPMGFGSITVRY
jgi:hypothetical protein